MRKLTYAQAIREAFAQLLAADKRVFIFGQGLWSPWYVGSSMTDLDKEFGRDRVIDSPVSENATTGAAIGAAIAGMRPIVIHPRMDFMLLAADQIVNQAANWSYMFGGKSSVPLVIRPIINRGGEQGAQHSQALHAWFAHLPGLKVVMPATPYDAKGLLIAAVNDGGPVMYIDDRWLYEQEGDVPEEMYEVPIGEATIRREGTDLTIVANSHLAAEAIRAADALANEQIHVEVVDLRSIKPMDSKLIVSSVSKTKRALVVDGGWPTAGIASEVTAVIAENPVVRELAAPIKRLTLPDAPAPTASSLERVYYRTWEDIVSAAKEILALPDSERVDRN